MNTANEIAQQYLYQDLVAQRQPYTLNNLDFWSDFGKGFKMGFGGVMDGFSKIATPISAVVPGAGSVMLPTAAMGNAMNGLVQNIVPGLTTLD